MPPKLNSTPTANNNASQSALLSSSSQSLLSSSTSSTSSQGAPSNSSSAISSQSALSSSSSSVTHAQLTIARNSTIPAPLGDFQYIVDWKLTNALNVNTIIVQKLTVTYYIEDQNSLPIPDISAYTKKWCLWKQGTPYWEAWFIPAGGLRPTYDSAHGKPDFTGTPSTTGDDNYSNGMIQDRRGKRAVTRMTKGWVRYTGEATLYRIDPNDPNNSLPNDWLNRFSEYKPSNPTTPAGVLPYSDAKPGYPIAAMEGQTVTHDMVAYWNSCAWKDMPTVIIYGAQVAAITDTALWNLVNAVPPQVVLPLPRSGAKRKQITTSAAAAFIPKKQKMATPPCWVAREVYGIDHPGWRLFRDWLLKRAPLWFRWIYLSYGQRFAERIKDKPKLKTIIRRWMDRVLEKDDQSQKFYRPER